MKKTMARELYRARYGPAGDRIYELRLKGNRLPWEKAYANAKARCQKITAPKFKYYGAKGIQCNITPTDVKEVYFRDKAYNLTCPSLDRINPRGHYVKENIRFIEFADNRKMRLMNHPADAAKYEVIKTIFQGKTVEWQWDTRTITACLRKLYREYRADSPTS